ncbi:MAG: hypothetical protein WCW44_03275 [archaeon]|jgi:hypothetical protein
MIFPNNRLLFTFLSSLIIISSVFAVPCTFDANSVRYAGVTFLLKEDSSTETIMVFGIDYSKECLLSEFVNVDVSSGNGNNVSVGTMDIVSDEVPCPSGFQELVLKSFNGFSSGINCYGQFFSDRNYLQMNFFGVSSKLSTAQDKNFVFSIMPNDFTNSFGKNSSLTLSFPQGATIYSFSPQKTNFATPSVVNWTPFPIEQVNVNYKPFDFQKEAFANILPILIFVSVLFVLITGATIYFMRLMVLSGEKANYEEKISEVTGKLKRLEHEYMMRKIDETTFRRLFEQYHVQLNDLESEMLKLNNTKKQVSNKPNEGVVSSAPLQKEEVKQN